MDLEAQRRARELAMQQTPDYKSAASMANAESRIKPISYVATFGAELVGTMWLVFILGGMTAIMRGLIAGSFSDYMLQGLIGGAILLGVTAALFRTSAIFNWANSLAGFAIMWTNKRWWPTAFVSSSWFGNYDVERSGSAPSAASFGTIVLKLLVEWAGQLTGSIAGAALILLIMPSSVPTSVHLCGQPQVMGGITTTEALFTDIVGGTLTKWALLMAFGIIRARAMDDVSRSVLLASAFAAARAITAFTTQSNFNFWIYFGAGIFAGFHSDWWIWFVGDICSTVIALVIYYTLTREVNDEMEKSYSKMQ